MSRKKGCDHCGKRLKGLQVRWCSTNCASYAWYREHPEYRHRQQGKYRRKYRSRIYRWHHEYYLANKKRIRANNDAYYVRNREKLLKAAKKWRKDRSAWFISIIREAKNRPCTDCKRRYPYYVMDLDHVRGRKLCNPTNLRNLAKSLKRLFAELSKCEPVCANCHRKREHRRRKDHVRTDGRPPARMWTRSVKNADRLINGNRKSASGGPLR